jgi:hypothetical protein
MTGIGWGRSRISVWLALFGRFGEPHSDFVYDPRPDGNQANANSYLRFITFRRSRRAAL